MWININTNVVHQIGYVEAVFLEYMDDTNPTNNIIRLNVSKVCRKYKIPISTGQRAIRNLSTKGYLEKHSSTKYTLGDKFYSTFPEYLLKSHNYG